MESDKQAMSLWLEKTKAFGLHVVISALVFGAYIAVLAIIWSPPPYFSLNDSWKVVRIVGGVNLVVGPLLTFVVYRRGKTGLKTDLILIGACQLAFLAWGIYVTYTERPLYLAYNVDRFTLVRASDLVDHVPSTGTLSEKRWGPILVYARPARDQQERSRLINEVFFEGKKDIAYRPERYGPYGANKEMILAGGQDIRKKIAGNAAWQHELDAFLNSTKGKLEDFAFIPVEAPKKDAYLVFKRDTGEVVGYLDINPW